MPDEPQLQTASDKDATATAKQTWLSAIFATKGYLWAVFVAGFYLCGFLVLNAHLAKFGLSDYEFISSRYLLASANFAFFLVCFYLFAGRAVIHTPKWLSQDLQVINQPTRSVIWSLIVFLHSLIRPTFFCCLSAALYTIVALQQIETVWFYSALAGAFLISYTVDITNLDLRFRRANEIFQIIVEVGAIYVFFRSPKNIILLGLFGFYVGIAMYINLVIDSFQRRKITADNVSFTAVHSAIFLLTTSLGFGATYFGQVSSKIGGGHPQEVFLTLSKDKKQFIPKTIPVSEDNSIKGNLIYQTDKFLFLDIADETLRFRTDDIALIVIKREKQDGFLKLFEDIKRKTTNKAVERDVPQNAVRPSP